MSKGKAGSGDTVTHVHGEKEPMQNTYCPIGDKLLGQRCTSSLVNVIGPKIKHSQGGCRPQ